ncbi:MAG TPA: hypothetical protein VF701_19935, partial [Thermoanaerobaculia bacterium]
RVLKVGVMGSCAHDVARSALECARPQPPLSSVRDSPEQKVEQGEQATVLKRQADLAAAYDSARVDFTTAAGGTHFARVR